MKLLLMSDIHGNISALESVLADVKYIEVEACVLLGDLIDYGMHSNEVINRLKTLPFPVICKIFGNHESAIANQNYTRFSSERGRVCAAYTRTNLSAGSWDFINEMEHSGKRELEIGGKRILAVHGSLKDVFWKSVDVTDDFSEYKPYDYVLSGHSHIPHFFEKYFPCDNPQKRNKKKTVFINPGSVGQPRNINCMSQYAFLDTDTEEIVFKKVLYDIEKEQLAYNGQVDDFYKSRLKEGI